MNLTDPNDRLRQALNSIRLYNSDILQTIIEGLRRLEQTIQNDIIFIQQLDEDIQVNLPKELTRLMLVKRIIDLLEQIRKN